MDTGVNHTNGKPETWWPPVGKTDGFNLLFFLMLSVFFSLVFWTKAGGSGLENPRANEGDAGDVDLFPGLERCPGVGNGNPLQYFCLGNSMERELWQATVHGVIKSQTQLNTHAFIPCGHIWTTPTHLCNEWTSEREKGEQACPVLCSEIFWISEAHSCLKLSFPTLLSL